MIHNLTHRFSIIPVLAVTIMALCDCLGKNAQGYESISEPVSVEPKVAIPIWLEPELTIPISLEPYLTIPLPLGA